MTINDYFNNPINEDYFSISPEWDTPIYYHQFEDLYSVSSNSHWDTKTSNPNEFIKEKRSINKRYYEKNKYKKEYWCK